MKNKDKDYKYEHKKSAKIRDLKRKNARKTKKLKRSI
jgi:hypothetical protein